MSLKVPKLAYYISNFIRKAIAILPKMVYVVAKIIYTLFMFIAIPCIIISFLGRFFPILQKIPLSEFDFPSKIPVVVGACILLSIIYVEHYDRQNRIE